MQQFDIKPLMDMIDKINQYLASQMEPMTLVEVFLQYISPVLQLIVVVGGAIAGLYKYFKTKNQEVYQQLLREVYAPLFQYFVKQELLRDITASDQDYEKVPVLEYKNTTQTVDHITGQSKTNNTFFLGLNRQELIKVLDSINIGLAPKELYTLLSMYKVLVHLEETNEKSSKTYATSLALKNKVENELRREVILGYKKYHDKLDIKGGSKNDIIEIKKDRLVFKTK